MKRLLHTLMLAFGLAGAAFAKAPCGVYVPDDKDQYGGTLVFENNNLVREIRNGFVSGVSRYRQQGDQLELRDLESGYGDKYLLSADGKRLVTAPKATFARSYVLKEPGQCQPANPPPAAGCESSQDQAACCAAGDEFACADQARRNNDIDALKRACDRGQAYACVQLGELREKSLASRTAKSPLEALDQPPPECVEDTPQFSKQKCEEIVGQAIARALAQALAEAANEMQQGPAAWPAEFVDEQVRGCRSSGAPQLCNKATQRLWNAGRYSDARALLGELCTRRIDESSCKASDGLSQLGDRIELNEAAKTLPCGNYASSGGVGLVGELAFGDRGLVLNGFGSKMRARLENGFVRLRHDKGGDFVFAQIDSNRLLGIDSWNRYAVYQRQGGKTACAAPIAYEERPYVEDCGLSKGETLAQCCARGSVQGCNGLGNQAALAGRWKQAGQHYTKVCTAQVRVGCENMVRSYVETGDASIPAQLKKICSGNAKHVACDVNEQTDFEALRAILEMNKAFKDLEKSMSGPKPSNKTK